jgi:hypothetical protein
MLLLVVRVKHLFLGGHSESDMNELASGSAASHFDGLAAVDQAIIEGFDDGIVAGGDNRSLIQDAAGTAMTPMPDGPPSMVGTRLTGVGGQTKVRDQWLSIVASAETIGDDQQPGGAEQANALDRAQVGDRGGHCCSQASRHSNSRSMVSICC